MGQKGGKRDDRGASLVEFALVLPIFALLLFGLIDFGLVFGGFITLRNGVNAGARAASLDYYDSSTCGNNTTAAMLCTITHRIGSLPGVVPGSIKVAIAFPGGLGNDGTGVGQPVEICAEADLQSTTGITTPFLQNKAIHAVSELLIEKPVSYGAGTTTAGYSC